VAAYRCLNFSLPLLKFLIKEDCNIDYETVVTAATAGSIPVLEYLLELIDGFTEQAYLLETAALSGHLHILQWAADNDSEGEIEWNDYGLCYAAAQSGSIQVLQFLQHRGANLAEHNVNTHEVWAEESITTAAARSERKEVLLWLKQQGILPTVHAMCESARFDMLDICLFLLHTECNCPWDASVLTTAANDGCFELVQALYERGCPIDVHAVCSAAACNGRVDILQYLQQLPDEPQWTPEQLTSLLNVAGINEHLAVAKWLRQQGAEWPTVLGDTTEKWQGKALQWARRQGCTSDLPADSESEESSEESSDEEE
jgi:hypothetical protein